MTRIRWCDWCQIDYERQAVELSFTKSGAYLWTQLRTELLPALEQCAARSPWPAEEL